MDRPTDTIIYIKTIRKEYSFSGVTLPYFGAGAGGS